jgi:membrane protein implicated in regulation of membrane protease activity
VSPADEYSSRLVLREASRRRLEARLDRIGRARLLLAALAIALALASQLAHRLSPLWVLLPAGAFAAAVARHAVLRRRHLRASRAAAFYRGALARIEDRWAGDGRQEERFNDVHHVYAADLDLFGPGSLFELLCAARTRMGEETPAHWLLAPASIEEIRTRHACIADLRDRLALREEIAILGDGAPEVHPQGLQSWSQSPNLLGQASLRLLAILLPCLSIASALLWALRGLWIAFAAILIVEAALLYAIRGRLERVLDPAADAFEDLRTLAGLLSRIEREPFEAPPMRALVEGLSSAGRSASRAIARLSTLAQLAESRGNLAVR